MAGTAGIAVEEVEVVLEIVGMGRLPVGLTVACILAREEAVGAYNLEELTEVVGFDRAEPSEDSAGGGGGALTFLRISA